MAKETIPLMLSRFQEGRPSIVTADTASWLAFAQLCNRLAATRSKLAKRAAMAEYLRALDAPAAGIAAQYLTGAAFAQSDERKTQVGGRMLVNALEERTQASAEQFHAAYRKHGDLGATAEELLAGMPQSSAPLALTELADRLGRLADTRTQAAKAAHLRRLLQELSPVEVKYLVKLLLGDMRIGIKQSLVEEAIAEAAGEELTAVRRAETMLGDIPAVVELAWRHALDTARFRMFHALGFMLATPLENAEEAAKRFAGTAALVEDKYDGMRAQVHCGDPTQPGRVRIFSRTREDVTAGFPELVAWFAGMQQPAILDGEILAWDFANDRALPFTALQQRLGRKHVTAAVQQQWPVIYMAFDLLLHNGQLLLEQPLGARKTALAQWSTQAIENAIEAPVLAGSAPQASLFAEDVKPNEDDTDFMRLRLAPTVEFQSAPQIDAAFDAAQIRGNEGLMLKSLDSIYEPGRRGLAWLKLKRELATLDVVVTAVEYGHGRRAGVLSDYTFAVRDGDTLKNAGKAYSGLTDAEIATMTQWFLEHTLEERGGQLLVEPQIVIEVAFNNVMESTRHNSGYSLRFPRIVQLRPDKPVGEIDTLSRVAEIFKRQHAGTPK